MKAFQRIMAMTLALLLTAGSSCLPVRAAETENTVETTAVTEGETMGTEATEETAISSEATETTQPPTEETTAPPEEPEKAAEEEAEESHSTVDVPEYVQEDYPEVPFGAGTVADCGGSVTALAMVASYLTGYDYTPDVLAEYFDSVSDDDSRVICHGAETLGLSCREADDFQTILQALEGGSLVICKMNDQSVFTDDTHMIVLKELTAEGRIYVSDPLRSNQEKSMLQDGFEKGFPKGWISTGWEEAWIFDPVGGEVSLYTGEPYKQGEMPLYNQKEYQNVMYGDGTIASDGCGITALAMVATCMTGHTYTPDQLARYFGGYNGNNVERLLNASDELQLPWHAVANWHKALEELKEGDIAIILVNSRSIFADCQHFIVATGVTEDGRILINDPNGTNYSNPVLKDGFENGFTSGQIATGYSGAWVYDMDAMPDKPFIYEEEEVYVEPRYTDLNLSKEDLRLLAKLVWVEARGEEADGQQAVAEVILNRLASGRFQSTMRSVVYAENQFIGSSYIDEAEPNQTQYDAVERALNGPYILPMDVCHFATYPVNKDVWGTIGSHVFCYQWSAD